MSITLNTYGLRSINAETFNTYGGGYLPKPLRDLATTLLRINNLVLNILGYIPGVQQISGCVRMGIGTSIILLTLALGSSNEQPGLIVGRWYKEAIYTGIAQIARGVLEAMPGGSDINLILDCVATLINVKSQCSHNEYDIDWWDEYKMQERENRPPYFDPHYPWFLFSLHLA